MCGGQFKTGPAMSGPDSDGDVDMLEQQALAECRNCGRRCPLDPCFWSKNALAKLLHRLRHPDMHPGPRRLLVCRCCTPTAGGVPQREDCCICGDVLTYHGPDTNTSRAQKQKRNGRRMCKKCVALTKQREAIRLCAESFLRGAGSSSDPVVIEDEHEWALVDPPPDPTDDRQTAKDHGQSSETPPAAILDPSLGQPSGSAAASHAKRTREYQEEQEDSSTEGEDL